jgi:Fe-S oxidoreductase
MREDWAKDLGVKLLGTEKAETLLFVGCSPAYDPRIKEIARALVRILKKAGIDFGILGKKESCCGNEIRRMGEGALFKKLMKDNSAQFQKSGAKRIIAISPHCFNAFKNEYTNLEIPVEHYTETLARLIDSRGLEFSKAMDLNVTYHDPCFLGKQNKIFDEPRKVLSSIPGVNFVEMDRSRERSLCCEGGGGRMWSEGGTQGTRNGEIRTKDAVSLGASVVATSCPFCLLTLEDSAKISGLSDRIRVKDIAELVAEAVEIH